MVEQTVTTQAYLNALEMARPSQTAAQGELDALNGKRLGVATGSVFDQVALERLPGAQVSYFNAQPDIVTALLAGKVDAMITDEPMARDIVSQTPGLRLLPELFRTDSYAFAFPLDHTALRDEVNTALAELKADGTLAEMDARWFGEDSAAKVLPDLPLTGERGVVRFATSTSCAPFAYVKDGQIVGYDIEAALRICHRLGYALEITDMDTGAMVPGIQAGKFDMGGVCLTVTEERKQSVLFSEADYTGGIVAIVRSGAGGAAGDGGGEFRRRARLTPEWLSENLWLAVIMLYYLAATFLPIDKIVGKLYPVFGLCLIIMALGVGGATLLLHASDMPELTLPALTAAHPAGTPRWAMMFVTVACGAVSGFHATQSPMMARCGTSEREGRRVFYGAMAAEGIIALIWAAAGVTFYTEHGSLAAGMAGLQAAISAQGQGGVAYDICTGLLDPVGGVLAMVGVIACPVTSGDTAFRSTRLTIADWFHLDQANAKKRALLAVPLLAAGFVIVKLLPWTYLWRYFSWSNPLFAALPADMGWTREGPTVSSSARRS